MDLFLFLILWLNLISALIIIPYPINLLFLTICSTNWKDPVPVENYSELELPSVTIQIPIFNEEKIIQKTLGHLENINYPLSSLKIQILDDSTDDTSQIIDKFTTKIKKKGILIDVIRRSSREGFKAGALGNGLTQDDSEFVAVFDSDFEISSDFLVDCIHYFKGNAEIGAVQTKWGYSNLDFSLFTRSMSIGLDGHFLVEKLGRKSLNANITFNGTGGIWRRATIETSGGWSSETLAEDLDLAYRSQMKGYKIIYLSDVVNRQEIPPTLRSWIIQQSRWSKGFSQNLRKNFRTFLASDCSIMCKIQGTFHLGQYLIPLMILLNIISGTLLILHPSIDKGIFSFFGFLFAVSATCGILAYSVAVVRAGRSKTDLLLIPLFLFWGGALIVRMTLGTLVGFIKEGGEFERTPKYNLSKNLPQSKPKIHDHIPLDKITIVEIIFLFFLIFGAFQYISLGSFFLFNAVYLLFLSLGLINLIISEIVHALAS